MALQVPGSRHLVCAAVVWQTVCGFSFTGHLSGGVSRRQRRCASVLVVYLLAMHAAPVLLTWHCLAAAPAERAHFPCTAELPRTKVIEPRELISL